MDCAKAVLTTTSCVLCSVAVHRLTDLGELQCFRRSVVDALWVSPVIDARHSLADVKGEFPYMFLS